MPMITGLAYADLLVRPATADRWTATWQTLGFTPAGVIRTPDTTGYTLRRPGGAQLIISVATPGGTADADLDKYGEGIRDLAFFTPDVPGLYAAMTGAGAAPVFETGWTLTGGQIAVTGGTGRLRHTLLQTPRTVPPAGFDHASIVVPATELDTTRAFYQQAGFDWAPATPTGGVISGALTAGSAALTLLAPNPRSGQLEQFLASNTGVAAVRHLALPTTDITRLVDEVTTDPAALIRWIATPPGWDQDLTGHPDLRLLTGRGVITGRDQYGRVLRQCFTSPLVPGCGLYAEVIQRRNHGAPDAVGFGWDTTDQLLTDCPGWSPV